MTKSGEIPQRVGQLLDLSKTIISDSQMLQLRELARNGNHGDPIATIDQLQMPQRGGFQKESGNTYNEPFQTKQKGHAIDTKVKLKGALDAP